MKKLKLLLLVLFVLLSSTQSLLFLSRDASSHASAHQTPQTPSNLSNPQALSTSGVATWTNITTSVGPRPFRGNAQMVYDAADGYSVLIDETGATWKFSAGSWIQISASSTHPGYRLYARMVYDAADGYVVYFGGLYVGWMNDTWKFQAGTWTNITSTAGLAPSGRNQYALGYDDADHYVLLFGGFCSTGFSGCIPRGTTGFSDTWKFSGGSWTNITSTVGTAPSADNFAASIVYDSSDGYTILVGQGGTWKFSGGSWSKLVISGPIIGSDAGLVYDNKQGYVVVFGGCCSLSQTWKFSSGAWTNITSSVGAPPSPRLEFGMSYDSADGYAVLFGGEFYSGSHPTPIFFDDTWKLSLASAPVGGSVVATVPIGSHPWGVAYDSANEYVYVSTPGDNTTTVISGTIVVATIPVRNNPSALVYDPKNGYVYVANGTSTTGSVTVIKGTTVIAAVPVAISPGGIAYDSANGYIYVGSVNSRTMSVINGTTVVATVQVGHGTDGVAYDNENGYVYAAGGDSNTVLVISGTTLIATVPVGSIPIDVAYDSGNGLIYVTNSAIYYRDTIGTVSLISGTSVVATVTVQNNPWGVTYDSGNGYVYVNNYFSNSTSVINGATLVATIPVGQLPLGIAYDSGNGYVYVANNGGNTVSIISSITPFNCEWDAGSGRFPNQACPPWQAVNADTQYVPVLLNGNLTLRTSSAGQGHYNIMFYKQNNSDISFPAYGVIQARLKVDSDTSLVNYRAAAWITFVVAPYTGNTLFIGQDTVFLLTGPSSVGQSVTVDTHLSFHTYTITVNSTGTIHVYQDDTPILTGSTYYNASPTDNGPVPLIEWGEGGGAAFGMSEWQLVRHNAHATGCRCIPAPSGLVSWWPGDGNTSDIVGNHTGILENGASFGPGEVGQAFSFNGINQFVNVTNDPAWNFGSNPFSIDLWVKFNQPPGHAGFIGQDERPGNFNKWFFGMNPLPTDTGVLTFAINGPSLGPITTVSAPWTPNAGQWHHVAVTRGTAGTYTLYIDGANVASATNTTPIPNVTANLIIGAASWPLNGQIDEVQIFSSTLSSSEVQAIYNAGSAGQCRCVTPPAGLVSWWPADGNANDVVGGNSGSFQNGATFASGEVGQAFSFSGTNYVVNSTAHNIPTSGPISFDAWIKYNSSDSMGVNPEIITVGGFPFCSDGGIHGIILGGKTAVGIVRGCNFSTNFNCLVLNAGVGDNNWHYIATVWNGTYAFVYVDGSLRNQCLGTDYVRSTYVASIGGRAEDPGNSPFKGLVDEAQIFNRALSSSEVQAIYNAGSAGQCRCVTPPAGLVSWWPLDGNANDIQDGNSGKVVGTGGQFVPAEVGLGFQSGGPGSLILVNDAANLTPASFTIDAWAKINALTVSDLPIVWKGNSIGADVTSSYSLEVFGNPGSFQFPPNSIISGTPAIGKAFFTIDNGTFDQVLVSSSPIAIGAFVHYAVSINGTRIRLYINGQLDIEANQMMKPAHSRFPFQIGGANGTSTPGFYFNGAIDELDLYNHALTPSEVQSIFNAGSSGKCKQTTPAPTDFTISVSPATAAVLAGQTATSTVTVTGQNGFTDTVNLATSISPSTGLTCTLSPASVSLSSSTTSGSSTLSCSGSALFGGLGPSAYAVTVTGTGATSGKTHSTTFTVTVEDFTISASPTSVSPVVDVAGTSSIMLGSLPVTGTRFSGTVSLTVTTNSTSLSCTVSPTSDSFPFSPATLSCTGSAAGNYLATVTGTSGTSLSHSVTVVYHVRASIHATSTIVSCSPSSVSVGTVTTCTVTVTDTSSTGATNPTGTVTFVASGSGSFAPPSGACGLSASGTNAAACQVTFTSGAVGSGSQFISASYSGDSTHSSSVTTSSFTLTVTKSSPTVSSTVSPASIAIGGSASDLAMLTGGFSPTGTVTYTAYSDSACTTLVYTSASIPLGTSSGAFTPSATGAYFFIASYSGDANNNVAATACGATGESLTVAKATPTVTTAVSPASITIGGSAKDVATVSSGFSPSGAVTYTAYSDTACTTLVFTSANVPLGTPSAAFTPTAPGTYRWVASYSGDSNNNAVATTCGAAGETLTVAAPFDYTLAVTPTSVSVAAGGSTSFTITATLTGGTGQAVNIIGSISPVPSVCQPAPGSPPGVSPCGTVTISPLMITPASNGATSVVSLTTTSILPPGTYTFTITGSPSGKSSSSAVFTLTVTSPVTPDFAISANPMSLTLSPEDSEVCQVSQQGQQQSVNACDDEGQVTITIAPLNGFTGQVTLSVSSVPSLGVELSKTVIDTRGTSILKISEASPGTYVVTITGTSGSLSDHATINITVRSPEKLKCGGDKDCNIESDAPLSNTNFQGHSIHFTMIGEAGMTGAANVTIARSAVPDINRIKVLVDHNELSRSDLTVTSDDNSYHVYFKVTFHSNVDVEIDLNPASTILSLDPTIFYVLVGGIIGLIAVVGAAVGLRRRKK